MFAGFAAGCTRVTDPCPLGTVKKGQRCVSAADAATTDEESDASANPEPPEPGSGQQPPGVVELPSADASEETPDADRPLEKTPSTVEAARPEDAGPFETFDAQASGTDASGSNDASLQAPDVDAEVADAASDAHAAEAQVQELDAAVDGATVDAGVACAESELAKWRSFQVSSQMNAALIACYYADPTCAFSACSLGACLRRTSSVVGCAPCADDEVLCLMSRCSSHCRSSATSDTCRACACRERCIGGTSSCAMGTMDICSDCDGDWCANVTLDPALIMRMVAPAF